MATVAIIKQYLADYPEHYEKLFEYNKQSLLDTLVDMKPNELREELRNVWCNGCKGFDEPGYDLATDLADRNDDDGDDGEPLIELLYRANIIDDDEYNRLMKKHYPTRG